MVIEIGHLLGGNVLCLNILPLLLLCADLHLSSFRFRQRTFTKMLLSQTGARRAPARQALSRRLCSADRQCDSVTLPASLPCPFVHSNRLLLRKTPASNTRVFAATSMFSKFSDQALRIVTLSQQQARWLGYTEVLLLLPQPSRRRAALDCVWSLIP